MLTKRAKRNYSSEIINLEEIVPQTHFLRVIEKIFWLELYIWRSRKLYSKVGKKKYWPNSFDKDSYNKVPFSWR